MLGNPNATGNGGMVATVEIAVMAWGTPNPATTGNEQAQIGGSASGSSQP